MKKKDYTIEKRTVDGIEVVEIIHEKCEEKREETKKPSTFNQTE